MALARARRTAVGHRLSAVSCHLSPGGAVCPAVGGELTELTTTAGRRSTLDVVTHRERDISVGLTENARFSVVDASFRVTDAQMCCSFVFFRRFATLFPVVQLLVQFIVPTDP